jgi:acyl-CoA thioesterase-1
VNNDPGLLEPFWTTTVMREESLFFLEHDDGAASSGLLFPPGRVLALTSAAGDITFEEGRDYVINAGESREAVDGSAGIVRVVPGPHSRMPVTSRAQLASLIGGPEAAFHQRQAVITYEHQPGLWSGYVPVPGIATLPRTVGRLQRRQALTIAVAGDSISEGYNASGFMGVAPHQPPYAALVASALEVACGMPVAVHNCAVAGWTADHGVHDVDRVTAANPDLVFVAYGMNDAGYADADHFAANIARILAGVRLATPAAEFVLVAPMLPNPEWDYPAIGRFPAYRDALAGLCGNGVVLADMTALWDGVLRRKSWHDLAGNGFNHPNDFGHRLYAQVILAVLMAHLR